MLCLCLCLFCDPDWVVSINLRGRRRSTVKMWMFAGLALFKSGTIFYLLFSEKHTLSRKRKNTHTQKKKLFVVFFLLDSHFSASVSTPCLSIFNYASALLLFVFFSYFLRMFWLISAKERKKKKIKKNLNLLSVSLGVLCRGSVELEDAAEETVDSFTLKKAPLCCRSTQGEIIVQNR